MQNCAVVENAAMPAVVDDYKIAIFWQCDMVEKLGALVGKIRYFIAIKALDKRPAGLKLNADEFINTSQGVNLPCS